MQQPTTPNIDPQTMSPIALFRKVFGKHENQTLSEFMAECKPLTTDEKFVAEVRAYAAANP